MDNVEKFIHEINIRPILWDISREDFSNKAIREEKWLEIYRTFYEKFDEYSEEKKDSIVIEVKKRWKNLRNCYGRELRNQKSRRPSGGTKRKKYVYFDQLKFLTSNPSNGTTSNLKKENGIAQESNLEVSEEDSKDKEIETILSKEKKYEDTNSKEDEMEVLPKKKKYEDTNSKEDEMENVLPKKKKHKEGMKEEELEVLHKKKCKKYEEDINNGEDMEEVVFKKRRKNEEADVKKLRKSLQKSIEQLAITEQQFSNDEDRLFLLSMVKDLKEIPSDRKLQAKCEMMSVISKFKCDMF